MTLGNLLHKLRNEKRISQDEVAQQIGVSQSTYYAWENDRSSPKAEYYVRLAAAFGVDLKDLIPQNLTVTISPANGSAQEPTVLNAQTLYEDLTASQKQLIQLQKHRIDQLEQENQQLREQINQPNGKDH